MYVKSLKDMLMEARLGMEPFNKGTKCFVVESYSPKPDGGCIGSIVQRDGTFLLVLVPHEHNIV